MRCPATILLHDDRMGSFTVRCVLDEEHDGEHSRHMGSTEPPARMVWSGTFLASPASGDDIPADEDEPFIEYEEADGDDMTFKIAPRKRTIHRGHVVARPTEDDDTVADKPH